MAYKCVHCSKTYDDGSQEILTGCNECHGRFFFYIKQEQLDKMKENVFENGEFSPVEKEQMEQDVR